jgi:hypothetical protein
VEESFLAKHEVVFVVPVIRQKPQDLNDRRMFLKLGMNGDFMLSCQFVIVYFLEFTM